MAPPENEEELKRQRSELFLLQCEDVGLAVGRVCQVDRGLASS